MADYSKFSPDKPNKMSIKQEICDWINTLLSCFFVILLLLTFLVKQVSVDGSSMENTLFDGERLIISSLFFTPQKEDIVIVRCEGLQKDIVKRVIATEGQMIDINFNTGEVFVDNILLDEPYIKEPTYLDEHGHIYPTRVPKDCVFVMGDNRNGSEDSRSSSVGFVHKDTIVGKVYLRIFPFDRIGTFY